MLLGDATRAQEELGWKARVSFDELVRMMVDYDLEREQMNAAALAHTARLENKVGFDAAMLREIGAVARGDAREVAAIRK